MAALAAGVASSMAQSNVYSLNVVGYVNVPMNDVGNYYLLSNPLDNTTNDLNTLLPGVPVGTGVALWSEALQDFSPTSPTFAGGAWVPDVTISPFQGFFVIPNGKFTNTFVGTVRQYAFTNSLVGGGNYECIGSVPPVGGSITNVLAGYPAGAGDVLGIWSEPIQDFSAVSPTFAGGHWTPDYNFNVGDGFFMIRNGGPVTWVSQFTVP